MDDRLKIFSLWTDDTYKDLREKAHNINDADFVREVANSNFICGKNNIPQGIVSLKLHVIQYVTCKKVKY